MRVALVCPYSVTYPGGVGAQVLGLAAALRRGGHVADVIAPCDGEPPPGVLTTGRSLRIPVNGSIAPMSPTPSSARRTTSLLRVGNYDVIHLHEPLAPSITIPALLSTAAPLVGTFHAAGHRTPYRWSAPVLRPLSRRLRARVAVSESARSLAAQHLGGTYEIIPNGIDLRTFAPRQAARPSSGPPTVLFLGRHEDRKGLSVLLEAFTALPVDARLLVAGTGPQTARLREQFGDADRVTWLGWLDDAGKVEHLFAADVVCAPSLHGESFGLVLLEALAAGCAVVASDIVGYRDLLSRAPGAARLVPPGDPGALRRVLLELLGDPALLRSLGDAGTAATLGHGRGLGLDELATCYLSVYRAVT